MSEPDLATIARETIEANDYMTLGTADAAGTPWVSPVWYASAAEREFFWVSVPDARHSGNIAVRPELAIVIFDSRAPIGDGQGVYASGLAQRCDPAEIERGIEIFSERSQRRGRAPWEVVGDDGAVGPAGRDASGELRLYRATATQLYVLDPTATVDRRVAVCP